MATSSLFHSTDTPPTVTKGHGTGALGPTDSSDSGSDVQGGPGFNHRDDMNLDRGTTSDADLDREGATAGPDLGDAYLDSDSDRNGTGERGAAGRDASLATDEILYQEDGETIEGETIGQHGDGQDTGERRRGNARHK